MHTQFYTHISPLSKKIILMYNLKQKKHRKKSLKKNTRNCDKMKNMNKKYIIFGLILLAGTSIFAQSIKFSAKDIDGKNVSEKVFADSKITMVNVWGTFCGPCIREMPDLGVLNKKYGDDFQIVGIVIDAVNSKGLVNAKTVNSAKNIVKTTGADYPHIIPDFSLLNGVLSEIYAVPTTFFVDSSGKIVGKVYTGSRTLKQWQEIVESFF